MTKIIASDTVVQNGGCFYHEMSEMFCTKFKENIMLQFCYILIIWHPQIIVYIYNYIYSCTSKLSFSLYSQTFKESSIWNCKDY
jgi:hypothetical protein